MQVLVLNGTHDRETGVALEHDGTMDAVDIVLAVRACPPRMHPTLPLNMHASLGMPHAYLHAFLTVFRSPTVCAIGTDHRLRDQTDSQVRSGQAHLRLACCVT